MSRTWSPFALPHLSFALDDVPVAVAADRARPRRGVRAMARGVSIVALLSVAGCSWVPDWANPWSDSGAPATSTATAAPEEFPELGDTPTEVAATAPAERAALQEGLVADREASRQYADQTLRAAQVDTRFALAPRPAEAPAVAPTPAAAPTPAVAAAPAPRPIPAPSGLGTAAPQVTPAVATTAFNAFPPALSQGGAQTVVISSGGVQHVGGAVTASAPAAGTFAASPVRSLGGFSPQVQQIAANSGPVLISSQGVVRPDSTAGHRFAGGRLVPASFGGGQPPLVGGEGDPALTVNFANASDRVDTRARAALAELAAQHRQVGGFIKIVGHASQRTRDMSYERHLRVNFDISLERAQAVARELQALGVPSGAILIEARGSREPLFLEIMPSGEAQNRRAELFLVRG